MSDEDWPGIRNESTAASLRVLGLILSFTGLAILMIVGVIVLGDWRIGLGAVVLYSGAVLQGLSTGQERERRRAERAAERNNP